jgi:hypothetical protein
VIREDGCTFEPQHRFLDSFANSPFDKVVASVGALPARVTTAAATSARARLD